ncbi:MAG: hypothetical protein RL495_472 [Verrucomicrobiota bacterium]|jgi:hypothetical protein
MKHILPPLTALLLAPLGALHAAETQPVSTSAPSAADFSYAPPSLGTGKLPPPLPETTRYITVHRGGPNNGVRPYPAGGLTSIASFHRI